MIIVVLNASLSYLESSRVNISYKRAYCVRTTCMSSCTLYYKPQTTLQKIQILPQACYLTLSVYFIA